MSWAFLALGLGALVLTFNAFWPARGWVRIPAFFASWLVNELALYTILWEALATLLFARYGALAEWPGRVGVALMLVSSGALVVLHRRGHGASSSMRAALGEHAGDMPWPRVPALKLWLPFSPARAGVRRIRNVVFAHEGRLKLRLDVYLPKAPGERRPAIIQIHGGGWVIGDKREQGLPLLYHLASHGWVGFNANYRLSPRATFPDHLVDVKRAIAWVRAHADEYGVDPEFICITGGSAGGHLAALAALTANEADYQPGFEGADTRVQAAVCFYGIYCFVDRLGVYPKEFISVLLERLVMKAPLTTAEVNFRRASPLDRIHRGAPPMLIVHGDNDTLAPVEYARHFVEELRKVSDAHVFYAEIPGAQHAFDVFASPRTNHVVEGVERFLATLYARSGRDGRKKDSVEGAAA